jgi:DNA-binding CsgD family transcriptional regulator
MKKRKYKRPKRLELLNKKELRIMRLKGMGYTTAEIGTKLGLSPQTIEVYRTRSVRKLRIESMAYRKLAFKLAADLI